MGIQSRHTNKQSQFHKTMSTRASLALQTNLTIRERALKVKSAGGFSEEKVPELIFKG